MAKRARPTPPDFTLGDSEPENGDGGNNGTDGGSGGETSADSASDSGSVINPGTIAGNSGDSGTRQRKQRSDRGKSRGPRSEKGSIDLGDFAQILSEIHSGIALATSIPEIALDESAEEHIKLARAIERVKRHYDLPTVTPVALDWFLLGKAILLIYGSRIIAYNMRMRANNAKPVNNPPAMVNAKPNQPQPSAPPPPPNAPPKQSAGPIAQPFAPPPSHIRAAPIPGFEGITLDIPANGSAKPN
jgi:hypothetical protein